MASLHPPQAASAPQASVAGGRQKPRRQHHLESSFPFAEGACLPLSFPLPAHVWATLLLSLELKLISQRASEARGKVPGAWAVPPAI